MRDLEADQAICEAATPGPWQIGTQDCVVQDFWDVDGSRQLIFDAKHPLNFKADTIFTAAARTGWPEAIKRALAAEERVDKLEDELRMLHDTINQSNKA
ncbi:hypothetical protein D3C76_224490 [compost metagenome]